MLPSYTHIVRYSTVQYGTVSSNTMIKSDQMGRSIWALVEYWNVKIWTNRRRFFLRYGTVRYPTGTGTVKIKISIIGKFKITFSTYGKIKHTVVIDFQSTKWAIYVRIQYLSITILTLFYSIVPAVPARRKKCKTALFTNLRKSQHVKERCQNRKMHTSVCTNPTYIHRYPYFNHRQTILKKKDFFVLKS